ncbi:protein kinase [Synechocystis sp. LKSZ1]|uniref:protein kinase domain-containing protein n=1 Tax=Synechocystis sp. LKSZ1 TaxID=3144951 RepID=UPI00336BBD5D
MTTLLANRYAIITALGSGGFGETFLATDTKSPFHESVVVKQLKPVNSGNHSSYDLIEKLFKKEATALEELSKGCSQIPRLYDYFIENEQFYLVQEYIEGKNLAQIGPIRSEQAIAILTSLLNTLKHIHGKGIIHRDIKPENIILRETDRLPVLIDFGAVKETMGAVTLGSGSTVSSVIVGTRGFMAPEQSAGRAVFSTDLYALGLTMVYALTGKLPVEFSTSPITGELEWEYDVPHLDQRLKSVLSKAIKMEIASRFSSAEDMLLALHSSSPVSSNNLSTVNTIAVAPMVASPTPTVVLGNSGFEQFQSNSKKSNSVGVSVITVAITSILAIVGLSAGFFIMYQMKEADLKMAQIEKEKEEAQKALEEEKKDREEAEKLRAKAEENRLAAEQKRLEAERKAAATPKTIVRRVIVNNPSNSSSGSSATIGGQSGSKNIRSGPGTNYSVVGQGYTGDSLEILGNDIDAGGYIWYRVYHPDSGTTGWMASQLVNF